MTPWSKRLSLTAQRVLATVGILFLGYWATVFLSAKLFQAKEERELGREVQTRRGIKAVVPVEPAEKAIEEIPSEGSAVGMLAIPRLGLSTIVIEGVGDGELRLAAGHLPGTSLPGHRGNVVVASHRDTSFRALRFIRKGDAIAFVTRRGEYLYRVVSTTVVRPKDIQVLYPTKKDTLTLVTCYPFNFVGPAPKRFIVQAEAAD
jgi:sortase A